jgi:hypothetical protein
VGGQRHRGFDALRTYCASTGDVLALLCLPCLPSRSRQRTLPWWALPAGRSGRPISATPGPEGYLEVGVVTKSGLRAGTYAQLVHHVCSTRTLTCWVDSILKESVYKYGGLDGFDAVMLTAGRDRVG